MQPVDPGDEFSLFMPGGSAPVRHVDAYDAVGVLYRRKILAGHLYYIGDRRLVGMGMSYQFNGDEVANPPSIGWPGRLCRATDPGTLGPVVGRRLADGNRTYIWEEPHWPELRYDTAFLEFTVDRCAPDSICRGVVQFEFTLHDNEFQRNVL